VTVDCEPQRGNAADTSARRYAGLRPVKLEIDARVLTELQMG